MKRILIFSLAYFPRPVGGAEVAIKEITDRIPDSDIEFHMVTLRFDKESPREEQVGNVRVFRVGHGGGSISKALFAFHAAWKAHALHREHRYQGFWAMMSYMLFPIVLLRMTGVRVPYALTLQEGDTFGHMFERPHILPLRPLLHAGFKHARIVQAISTYLAAWARNLGFTGTLEVIPNGVDSERFARTYPGSEIDEIRDRLGKRMGDVLLITTSRLVHKNAVDDLIRALPHLPENVRAVILGTGTDEAKLRSLAASLGVDARTVFVGHVGHDDLPKYLKTCDIFVRASRSEGMGNSFIEAFAAGLPVVATQEGGIADFLYDEKLNPGSLVTGWAVTKDAPQEIATAVLDIMSRREKRDAVVRTARVMALERYDWRMIADAMQERVFSTL